MVLMFNAFISDCPSEMHAVAVILSVIGAVLAVALALLLIWRVLATIQVCLINREESFVTCAVHSHPHQRKSLINPPSPHHISPPALDFKVNSSVGMLWGSNIL